LDDILAESVYVHAAFCRPDSAPSSEGNVDVGAWRKILGELLDSGHEREMRQGWQDALQTASGEDERKLMDMVRARTGERP
jgi:hypothetical protein